MIAVTTIPSAHGPDRLSREGHGLLTMLSGKAPGELVHPRGCSLTFGIEDRGNDDRKKELENYHRDTACLGHEPAHGSSRKRGQLRGEFLLAEGGEVLPGAGNSLTDQGDCSDPLRKRRQPESCQRLNP